MSELDHYKSIPFPVNPYSDLISIFYDLAIRLHFLAKLIRFTHRQIHDKS